MNRREFIDRFRRDTRDLRAPYAWSDDEITDYANEAEDEACRRAGLIVDSTSDFTQVDLPAGESVVELDESIIYVRRVILASGTIPLVPRVVRSMDEEVPGWENSLPSVPRVFIPDWESGKIKTWPPVAQADTARMTVVRTPTRPMALDSDTPEIAKRYHAALLDWMKFLAYQKPDTDRFDLAKAAKFEERFTAEFGPASAAIDEHWSAQQYYDIGER